MDTTILLSLVATLFGILCAIISWVGARVILKQDELMIKLDDVKDDLHGRINSIDTRLVRVETIINDEK